MRLKIFVLFLIVIFQGCSFKPVVNQWEYNSTNAFNSYTKNFLSNNLALANSDLSSAIKYAKQGANLEQLAKIYLGSCALNKSVGIKDDCKEYNKVKTLISSKELEPYFLMLQNNLNKKDIEYLPKQYQSFMSYKLSNNKLVFDSIKSIKQISSQFIAASLILDRLTKSQINFLIKKASFYGYKKLVLFWLENLYLREDDLQIKEKIAKKIEILNS